MILVDISTLKEYHIYLLIKKLLETDYEFTDSFSEEVFFRTIINRAYYVSFLLSKYYLEIIKHEIIKNPRDFDHDEKFITEHTQVIKLLNNKDTRKLSSKLSELKNLRKNADYNFIITISEEECSQAIELMEDIVTKLKLLIE